MLLYSTTSVYPAKPKLWVIIRFFDGQEICEEFATFGAAAARFVELASLVRRTKKAA